MTLCLSPGQPSRDRRLQVGMSPQIRPVAAYAVVTGFQHRPTSSGSRQVLARSQTARAEQPTPAAGGMSTAQCRYKLASYFWCLCRSTEVGDGTPMMAHVHLQALLATSASGAHPRHSYLATEFYVLVQSGTCRRADRLRRLGWRRCSQTSEVCTRSTHS